MITFDFFSGKVSLEEPKLPFKTLGTAQQSLLHYNRALIEAGHNKEKTSQFYIARCMIYQELGFYKHCLHNIELAEPNYPRNVIKKLRENCLQLMKKTDDKSANAMTNSFKLSFPENPKLPFFVDGLTLKTDFLYGNFLATNQDLKAGHVIALINNPIVVISEQMREHLCFNCLKNNNFDLRPFETYDEGESSCYQSIK